MKAAASMKTMTAGKWLGAAAGLGLALGLAAPAGAASSYPERPIHVVIGFTPGGAITTIARLMAPKLSERLGQQVVIENKPGAGGVIATQGVARAAADGYTVFLGTMGNLAINPVLMNNLTFDIEKDFAPVTLVASSGFVLFVNPQLPVKSVAELIDYTKANPGKMNFSSSGNGGLPHMAGELFKSATGLNIMHVPYKGSSPSINDVVAGQVQMTFEAPAIGLPMVEAGRLKVLATTGKERLEVLPDSPTIAETVPGFDVTNWFGMVVPAGTPKDRIDRLQREIAHVLADPEIKERFRSMAVTGVGNSPEDFDRFLKDERARWARVVKEANITLN